MVRVVESIEVRGRGVNEDVSGELKDMKYAELFILNKDTLKILAGLKIVKKTKNEDGTKKVENVILVERSDLPGYDGKFISGAANKINAVFVYLKSPLFASGYTSPDAEKVTKTRTKSTSGGEAGSTYDITPADLIQIVRYGNEFDQDMYMIEGSEKAAVETDEKGNTIEKSMYNEPTTGMKKRIDKWIEENGSEVIEELEAIGVSVE